MSDSSGAVPNSQIRLAHVERWRVVIGVAVLAVVVMALITIADAWVGWKIPQHDLVYVALLMSLVVGLFLPSPYLLGFALIWLMSPVSANGNTTQSSVVAWSFIGCLGIVLYRERALVPKLVLPKPVVLAEAGLLLILCAYGLIGLAAHHSLKLIAWDLQPFLEFAAFMVLGAYTLRSRADVRRVFVILMAAAFAKTCLDFVTFADGLRHDHYSDLVYFLADRIIDAAPFLLLPVFIATGLEGPMRRRDNVLLLGSAALITALLVLSFTRTFWLGIAVGLAVAAAVERGQIMRRLALMTGVVGLVTLGLILVQPHGPVATVARLGLQRAQYTITQIEAPPSSFMARRQDEVSAAWPSIVNSHFLGFGAGASIPLSIPTVFQSELQTGIVAYLHNYYVQLLLNFGLPGLLAFAWLTAVCLLSIGRAVRRTSGFERALAMGVMATWIMGGIQLFFLSTPNFFHTPAFMAVTLALAIAPLATGVVDDASGRRQVSPSAAKLSDAATAPTSRASTS